MRIGQFSVFALCSFTSFAEVGQAADNPEAIVGVIADQCTSCHSVPGYEARWDRAGRNAPSFVEIAQNPEKYPPTKVRTFLQNPHWPMTQFVLSSTDIDAILAFIAGLK